MFPSFFLLSLLLNAVYAQDQLQINTFPPNPVICGSMLITWSQPGLNADPSTTLTINVASVDGDSHQTITDSATLGTDNFEWAAINVAVATQYVFTIFDATGNVQGQSVPITIGVGTNRNCLGGSSSSASSPADPTSTGPPTSQTQSQSTQSQSVSQTSSTSDTQSHLTSTTSRSSSVSSSSGGVNTRSGTASSAPASGPTNGSVPGIPIDTASSSGVSTGVKVGVGIAGAIVLLCGLAALYWYFASRRRMNSTPNNNGDHGGGAFGGKNRWAGLNSVDEYGSAGRFTNTATRETKGSVDPLGRSFTAGTPAGVSTATNLMEKRPSEISYPPQDQPGLAYLPPVAMYHSEPPHSPLHVTRSQSGSSTHRSRTNSQQDFPETPASRSLSSLGSVGIPIPMASSSDPIRRSKNGVARKPVPLYPEDVGELELESELDGSPTNSYQSNPFRSRPPSTTSTTVPTSAPADVLTPGSYTSQELAANRPDHLQHKGSFGELKPMQHVLVPDLPQPQRPSSPPIRLSR